MAFDKAVDSTALNAGLTKIADAIRAKGGTEGAMAFPDGFAEMIEAIQAGTSGQNLVSGIITVASDDMYLQVAHTLGEVPNLFVLNRIGNTQQPNAVLQTIFLYAKDINDPSTYVGYYSYVQGISTRNNDFTTNGDCLITATKLTVAKGYVIGMTDEKKSGFTAFTPAVRTRVSLPVTPMITLSLK